MTLDNRCPYCGGLGFDNITRHHHFGRTYHDANVNVMPMFTKKKLLIERCSNCGGHGRC